MLKVVTGLAEDCSLFNLDVTLSGDTSLYGLIGIGLDSNSVNSADIMTHIGGADVRAPARASLRSILTPGSHSIYWLEATKGSGNVTFHGVPIAAQSQSGLTGQVMG